MYYGIDGCIDIYEDGYNELNSIELSQEALEKVNDEYANIYQNHFINYINNESRFEYLTEQGRMLIISYDEFSDEMTPLIEWKNKYPRTRGRLEAISEKFENDNPEMANLYLQISLTNPELANPEMALDKINLLGGPKGQELNALKMPVLFLVGQDDTLMPPHIIKLASEYIKDSEFLIIPDCGHSVYWEKPYVFNSEVNRFISDSIS